MAIFDLWELKSWIIENLLIFHFSYHLEALKKAIYFSHQLWQIKPWLAASSITTLAYWVRLFHCVCKCWGRVSMDFTNLNYFHISLVPLQQFNSLNDFFNDFGHFYRVCLWSCKRAKISARNGSLICCFASTLSHPHSLIRKHTHTHTLSLSL